MSIETDESDTINVLKNAVSDLNLPQIVISTFNSDRKSWAECFKDVYSKNNIF